VSSDRQQATASSSPAIHTLTPAAAVTSDSLQQLQQWIGTPRAAPSYAAVAASPPRQSAASCSLVPSPRLTRAAKKRRGCSSPGDETVFAQLDGADVSPPSTPPEPVSPEHEPCLAAAALAVQPTATALQRPRLPDEFLETEAAHPVFNRSLGTAGTEPVNQPPPPPPWSRHLPSYWDRVICHLCLENSHGYRRFTSCEPCGRKKISN